MVLEALAGAKFDLCSKVVGTMREFNRRGTMDVTGGVGLGGRNAGDRRYWSELSR